MLRGAPLSALLLIAPAANALDVHGIRLGDRWDPSRIEEALSYPTVPSERRVKCSEHGDERCVGSSRYLSCDVGVTIEGRGGQVSAITLTLPTEHFEEEIAALKRELGPPTEDWSAPPDTAAHLLFRRRLDWRSAHEELFALRFSTMASISLTAPEESIASRYPPPL